MSGWDSDHPNYHWYGILSELCTVGDSGCGFGMTAPLVGPASVPFTLWYSGPGAYNLPLGLPTWARGDPIIHRNPERGIWLNFTEPGHRYYPGSVGHALYESGGKLWLYTLGVGVGANPTQNVSRGQWIFGAMHRNVRSRVLEQQLGP